MKKCLNCNSESLMISEKESSLIPSAKYAVCHHCGNTMFVINEQLIATPTNDNPRTKLLIQDAADCFGMEGAASLDGRTMPVDIQPSQTIESIKSYIEEQLTKDNYEFEDDEYDYEEEDYYEDDIDEEDEESIPTLEITGVDSDALKSVALTKPTIEPIIPEAQTNTFVANPNYMILLHNSGEKHLYMNTSPDFILNIINDIKEPFSLFELQHVPLKTEVKYSF